MALETTESSQSKNPWSTKQSIYVAIISLTVGIIIFTIAFVGMQQNTSIGVFNQPILSWMVVHRDTQITSIMKFVTGIADPMAFAIIVAIGAGFLAIIKRKIWRPILLIGATGIAAIVSTLLKTVVMNNRPSQIDMIAPFELDYSFPSGHTIVITVFLLVLGYLICSRNSNKTKITAWIVATIIGISLIATSRLYLGYHWLTDVTASVGLGFIILSTSIVIDRLVDKHFNN